MLFERSSHLDSSSIHRICLQTHDAFCNDFKSALSTCFSCSTDIIYLKRHDPCSSSSRSRRLRQCFYFNISKSFITRRYPHQHLRKSKTDLANDNFTALKLLFSITPIVISAEGRCYWGPIHLREIIKNIRGGKGLFLNLLPIFLHKLQNSYPTPANPSLHKTSYGTILIVHDDMKMKSRIILLISSDLSLRSMFFRYSIFSQVSRSKSESPCNWQIYFCSMR